MYDEYGCYVGRYRRPPTPVWITLLKLVVVITIIIGVYQA